MTIKVFIQWTRAGRIYGTDNQTADVASAQSEAAPDFGGVAGEALIEPVGGAITVLAGANPTVTEETGRRIDSGEKVSLQVVAGDKIAFMQSAVQSVTGVGDASAALQTDLNTAIGTSASAAAGDAGGATIAGYLRKVRDQLASVINATVGGFKSYTPTGLLTGSVVLQRVADANAYAVGDLVGGNVTPGNAANYASIANLGRGAGEGTCLRRIRLRSDAVARQGASFMVHVFRGAPTLTVGDNGVFNNAGLLATDIAKHVGEFQIALDRGGTDGAKGIGVPAVGSEVIVIPDDGSTLFYALETQTAFTPVSGESFTITAECARP